MWAGLETAMLGIIGFVPVSGLLRIAAFGAATLVFTSLYLVKDIRDYNKGYITKTRSDKNVLLPGLAEQWQRFSFRLRLQIPYVP